MTAPTPASPEMSLIQQSCDNATARIRFFRIAFGSANPGINEPGVEATGFGQFAAIGWEYAHNEHMTADIQLRVGSTRLAGEAVRVNNTAVNVGFGWF